MVNFDMFDEFTRKRIKESTQPLINKFEKFFGKNRLLNIKLVVDKIHEDRGGKTLYEVIGHINTTIGNFRTTESGWEIMTVIDRIIEELERKVTKVKEKIKTKRRMPANV